MEDSMIDYKWDLNQVVEPDFALEMSYFDQEKQEDVLWQARTGLDMDSLCGAVETIIFMSDRPISIQKIKSQIDEELPLRVLHDALTLLQKGFEEKHHGIRLIEVAEGYQFRTKATFSKYVQNLFKMNSLVLTPTALEVLAIIAYKQPISKTEVEKIRGVDSSHIVRALMDKRLVKICGRSEELGRPSLYSTTLEFLEVFNLSDISQLPPEFELQELATKNTVGNIADIKSVVFMGDKKKFDFDELEELDQLSQSIKDVQSDTNFTLLLKSEERKRIDGIETGLKKSAFDILEEFVIKEASTNQNKIAALSEILNSVIEPKVVDIDQEGVFNAPEIDKEWEEMQKEDETPFNWNEKPLFEEALELETALNDAFLEMTGTELEMDEMQTSELQEKIDELDLTVGDTILKGRDLDLDLNFLKDIET